jgi:hypothetical protein
MLLSKLDQIVFFDIFQPRWHDKVVLLKASKVDKARTPHFKVRFSKAPTMEGEWYVSKNVVKRCKKESNGTIMCYAVPLSKLESLEINQKDWRALN